MVAPFCFVFFTALVIGVAARARIPSVQRPQKSESPTGDFTDLSFAKSRCWFVFCFCFFLVTFGCERLSVVVSVADVHATWTAVAV